MQDSFQTNCQFVQRHLSSFHWSCVFWHSVHGVKQACCTTGSWLCCLNLQAVSSIPAWCAIISRFFLALHAFPCARASKSNQRIYTAMPYGWDTPISHKGIPSDWLPPFISDALNKVIGYTTKMTQRKSSYMSIECLYCEPSLELIIWKFSLQIKSYKELCCIKLVKHCWLLVWVHLFPLSGWCEAIYKLDAVVTTLHNATLGGTRKGQGKVGLVGVKL